MTIRALALSLFISAIAAGQTPTRVKVLNAADSTPVQGAAVRAAATTVRTDRDGEAAIDVAAARMIHVARIGFQPDSVSADAPPPITVYLQRVEQIEGMIVAATRSERRIEDDPLRVEALDREEVEEKIRMTPGDITMMLNETPGLRVQTTSPTLGAANVRVQGLRGRYTQILSDGLPLFGGQVGGLGMLQIPPMDLGGVEVIKGAASALYGSNALGGVINLRSRRPEAEPVNELLLNQTTSNGSDAIGYASRLLTESLGASALVGLHRQSQRDVDRDGWTDVARYKRLVVRPRLFWDGAGSSLMLTGGAMYEVRAGGPVDGAYPPSAPESAADRDSLRTDRYDIGAIATRRLGATSLSLRASHAHKDRVLFDAPDTYQSTFAEVSAARTIGTASVVVGGSYQRDRVDALIDRFDFDYRTPGYFGQLTFDVGRLLAVTASGRQDDHSKYEMQSSGRLSVLMRLPGETTLRLSTGNGFFAPSWMIEETEMLPVGTVRPYTIAREKAFTRSADLARRVGPVEMNATYFRSRVSNPVAITQWGFALEGGSLSHSVIIENVGPADTDGMDATARLDLEPFRLTSSYTFVNARDHDPETGVERTASLTPRHQASLVGSWETELTRAGVEVYYTGRQSLDHNPYRSESKPYTHIGMLVERRIGRARVFLNAENLLDYRQTKYDRLVNPTRGPGGVWTVDAWGPLEGRTANIGIRW